MLTWLAKNVRIILLAFVLALTVWVSAVTASDPDETRAYPSLVPLSIVGMDSGLMITSEYPAQIEVTLRAPQSIWKQLTADPALLRAALDLSGLAAGSHNVPIQVQVGIQPVRVMSVSPDSLDLTLEEMDVRSLPVEISLIGEPAVGYEAQEPILSADQVTVSGARSLMQSLARVSASLDISQVRQDVKADVTLLALDENDQPIAGLNLVPSQVHVTLPVVQQGGYRDLAVKVVVTGRVANGYRLTSILVDPPVVTVYSSDIALIDSLPGYVETVELNLNGVSADIETRLALNLPEGVSLLGAQDVLVQVGIAPIEGSLTLSGRPVTVTGLGTGLKATLSPLIVDLYLSGPLPLLETLIPSDVIISVDVTGLGPGSYQLTPIVTLVVQGLRVESILPGSVQVTIR